MLKVKAGDLDKMGLLFERYHRELFGYLYHMSGRPDVSEDIVQTVFYRMLKYRHTFTGEGSFRSWMYHLARNVLVDTAQKNKRMAYHHDMVEYDEKIGGDLAADEPLQKEQELAVLQEALSGLSPEHREVLVLSRFQELKYEEIARILDTTEGAIKVRVHRAMNELKKIYLRIEQ
ncbi:RNA polymerase sigma factor [Telluribacter humicola]|uniref:RNA polymerase sigma factor n=1 Tax=Telluribacter humicola TaxID=1720261 RepID=UPI001A9600E7|nr:RNA polymerase sigma factor [Telluribacter humicola]